MVNAFGEILQRLPDPKFQFVRAVGNKIIDSACDSYSGKVLKYLNKQGPIYIRPISEIKNLTNIDDLSDECSSGNEETIKMDSDDDVLLVSAFDLPKASSSTKITISDETLPQDNGIWTTRSINEQSFSKQSKAASTSKIPSHISEC